MARTIDDRAKARQDDEDLLKKQIDDIFMSEHGHVYLTLIVLRTIICALYWSDVDNSIFHGNYEKMGCALGIIGPKATAPFRFEIIGMHSDYPNQFHPRPQIRILQIG